MKVSITSFVILANYIICKSLESSKFYSGESTMKCVLHMGLTYLIFRSFGLQAWKLTWGVRLLNWSHFAANGGSVMNLSACVAYTGWVFLCCGTRVKPIVLQLLSFLDCLVDNIDHYFVLLPVADSHYKVGILATINCTQLFSKLLCFGYRYWSGT